MSVLPLFTMFELKTLLTNDPLSWITNTPTPNPMVNIFFYLSVLCLAFTLIVWFLGRLVEHFIWWTLYLVCQFVMFLLRIILWILVLLFGRLLKWIPFFKVEIPLIPCRWVSENKISVAKCIFVAAMVLSFFLVGMREFCKGADVVDGIQHDIKRMLREKASTVRHYRNFRGTLSPEAKRWLQPEETQKQFRKLTAFPHYLVICLCFSENVSKWEEISNFRYWMASGAVYYVILWWFCMVDFLIAYCIFPETFKGMQPGERVWNYGKTLWGCLKSLVRLFY